MATEKKIAIWKFVVGISIVFIVLYMLFNPTAKETSSTKTESAKPTLTLTQDQTDYLINLEKQGLVRIEPQNNDVYIDPGLWIRMDAKLKEDTGAAFAMYCAEKRGNSLVYVTIYDKMSGKKLAKWSKSWGFTIY